MADVKVKIGGIVLGIESRLGNLGELVPANYLPFLTDAPADHLIKFSIDSIPGLDGWELCFDTKGIWRLYQTESQWAFRFYTQSFGVEPFLAVFLEKTLERGEVVADQRYYASRPIPFALDYPVGEILFAHLLGAVGGLIVHACAVKDGDKALLFAGHSGAGKTTTARLWRDYSDKTLLSDDRVILRMEGQDVRVLGTPWHGDAKIVSTEWADLKAIFILKHATRNHLQLLRPVEISSRLFARSFPTFWHRPGLESAIALSGSAGERLPGWELGFVPDRSAVDFISPFFKKE